MKKPGFTLVATLTLASSWRFVVSNRRSLGAQARTPALPGLIQAIGYHLRESGNRLQKTE